MSGFYFLFGDFMFQLDKVGSSSNKTNENHEFDQWGDQWRIQNIFPGRRSVLSFSISCFPFFVWNKKNLFFFSENKGSYRWLVRP